MRKKSKVLILSSAYLPCIGGSELAIKNITDRLSDFEFDLITAKLDKNSPEYEKLGNVSVYRVGGSLSLAEFLLPKNLLPLAVFLKARGLLKNNDYIAVHAFQASGAAGAGWLLKYFYPKLPFLLTLQEGKNLQKQGFLVNFFRKLIIKKADAATALSIFLKDYLNKVRKDLPVEIIPNGVDIGNFSRQYSYGEMAELEEKLGIKPGDKIIISVSRLVEKNGPDLLIEALSVLGKNFGVSYKLIFVGEGPMKENLESKVKSLKLEGRVIFTGTVNPGSLPLYLKISDVFVRPSRSEGLGSAFLEAMAAEVPVVGTKVGGIPDFLEDRRTGLFSSHEPEDIAFKVRVVLENDKLKEEIKNNAMELVREKYDWDIIAGKFQKLYQNFQ